MTHSEQKWILFEDTRPNRNRLVLEHNRVRAVGRQAYIIQRKSPEGNLIITVRQYCRFHSRATGIPFVVFRYSRSRQDLSMEWNINSVIGFDESIKVCERTRHHNAGTKDRKTKFLQHSQTSSGLG